MERIQLFTIVKGSLGNAGPKAPLDICRILEAAGEAESFSLSCVQGMDYPIYLKAVSYIKSCQEGECRCNGAVSISAVFIS